MVVADRRIGGIPEAGGVDGIAEEFQGSSRGVRVNAVAPGAVWTPRIAALLGEEGRARAAANAPLCRVAAPADIASAILFLVSDLSAYVTGQTLVVDGGVSAKFPYPSGA